MKSVSLKAYFNKENTAVLGSIPANVTNILDVGCGTGVHAAAIRRLRPAVHIDGITVSDSEANEARNICDQVWIYNLEHGLPPETMRSYDCILCSHVIEHICWPERMLGDINRVLSKTNGILIVALPNLFFINRRFRILLGSFQYEEEGLWDETHFRWYTFLSGRRLIESAGFEVLKAEGSGYLPLGPIRKLFPFLCQKVDSFVCGLWPGLFGWQFLYIAKPVNK